MNMWVRGAIAATVAVICGIGVGVTFAAPSDHTVREQIGKPLQQAEKLLQEKQYRKTLDLLKTASAVSGKSPYEEYAIDEITAAAKIGSGDYTGAVQALQAVIATKVLPEDETSKRRLSIAQLEYQMKDFPGAVAAAESYYQHGGTGIEARRLIAQSYYLEHDYADAAKTIVAALDAEAHAGQPPDEALLLSLASSDYNLKNWRGYIGALGQLVASHPKHEYWVEVCDAVGQQPGFAPRLQLDLDRLRASVGAMNTGEQFVTAAELALTLGFPGDAKSFLQRGYAVGVLGKGHDAAREKRLVDLAERQSQEDMQGLPAQANAANASNDGLALEKLGEAYASYGRYDAAAKTLASSLKKGGLKNPEDAELHLGVVDLAAGRAAQAREILNRMKGADGTENLARLWLIKSAQH